MKRLHVIAGEASGDTHGAGLLSALLQKSGPLEIRGLGGPKMRVVAGDGIEDWIEEAAVVGLWEVLRHYGFFRRKFSQQLDGIAEWNPDAVILIDYPGFNLRMARALRARVPGIRIIYFISPQVWAWNRARIRKMAGWIDLMLCIFPFEVDLYRASGLRAVFVGHPIAGALDAPVTNGRDPRLIGLFPGSREREVARLFPVMLEAAERLMKEFASLRFVAVAASPSLASTMEELARPFPWCRIEVGTAHTVMARSAVGVVASGTATLEAAMLGLPHCLVYKVAWPTYFAGRALIRVAHLGIVNILAGRELVREFIQHRANAKNIAAELKRLIDDEAARSRLQSEMAAIVAVLSGGGDAYARAADQVLGVPGD